LLLAPGLLHRRAPTAEEQEIARRQLIFIPPGSFDLSPPRPRITTPPPKVKVDPRILRQIAPPESVPQPIPAPQPKVEPKELPSAPTPQPNPQPPPPAAAPKTEAPPSSAPKLEAPEAPKTQPNLVLPKASSNPLRDTLRDMGRNSSGGGKSGSFSAPTPHVGSQSPSAPGGGQSPGLNGAYSILTPTEGVDFSDYMSRVLTSIRRNWYAVMPESVQLGDRGRVILDFSIRRDGSVPSDDPQRMSGSGKEPLDRAAVSAIRASNPFDRLPPAFSGPEIRVRIIFLYNLPLDSAYQ